MAKLKNLFLKAFLFVTTILIAVPSDASQKTEEPPRKPAGLLQRELRLAHAQELLGKHYRKSSVRAGEKVKKINSRIYTWTRDRLPKKYRAKHNKVAQAIIDQSMKYQFDPVFVMSVIEGESSFNPAMRGKLDEIGLMQLRPATAEWIAKMNGIPYKGEETLLDPVQNIRIGTAFLHYLREKFDSHAQLYLAAYNMGPRNVNNALAKDVWPKDYPVHVMKLYVAYYSEIEEAEKIKTRTKKSIAAAEPSSRSASPGT